MSEDRRFEAYGMKVRVYMKTPDALDLACNEAAHEAVSSKQYDEEEHKIESASLAKAMREFITKKWMRYGEYVAVEFDLAAKTAIVVNT